ncbi:MAG: UPF0365 family protein, partial [Planctomycetes bacterium]|nr:UPF0365 family protein [Planctomycetota bacterium]
MNDVTTVILIVAGLIVGLILLAFLFLGGRYFKLWLRAFFTRARVGIVNLVMMSLRKVNPV